MTTSPSLKPLGLDSLVSLVDFLISLFHSLNFDSDAPITSGVIESLQSAPITVDEAAPLISCQLPVASNSPISNCQQLGGAKVVGKPNRNRITRLAVVYG